MTKNGTELIISQAHVAKRGWCRPCRPFPAPSPTQAELLSPVVALRLSAKAPA